jgi:chromosome segregation ATPase
MDVIDDTKEGNGTATIAESHYDSNTTEVSQQQQQLNATSTKVVDVVKSEIMDINGSAVNAQASQQVTESAMDKEYDSEIRSTDHPMMDLLSDMSALPVNANGDPMHNDFITSDDTVTSDAVSGKDRSENELSHDKQSDSNVLNGASFDNTTNLISPSTSNPIDATKVHCEETAETEKGKTCIDDAHNDMVAALQENLQRQMSAKAEAEDKVRNLESNVRLLEDQIQKQADEMLQFDTVQENLQLQMNAKAEAEHKARSAYDRVRQLEAENEKYRHDLNATQQQLSESREMILDKDRELEKVRNERDDQERKITALTTRLNAAKKLEAVKVNHVDAIEDDLKATTDELRQVKISLEQNVSAKRLLEQQLQCIETVSREQIELLESSLAEEKRLNEERKVRMKDYVEKKTEELRLAKEENDSLQIELAQTNRSLVDLNTRWKQLHTQWVQAQTRNRELQRDLQRTKKDSEHLHKQGDTLEMKLSRSANETEEHKNKRLAAKQELMSVLRALEMEREITTKLRDQIKFTFVPKMLKQQQTLNEIIHDFTTALEKLSIRLGKPLLPLPEESEHDEVSNASKTNGSHNESAFSQSDINPLVEKLDYESQKVSIAITSVLNNVERLRALVQASGDRTCFTVLSELVHTGGMESSPAVQADRARNQIQAAIGRSHRYGQIPGSSD